MSPTSRPRLEHLRRKKETLPASNREAITSVTTNDPDGIVWGAKAIGAVIGRNERQAYYLLETGALRGARKINGKWSAKRSSLLGQWDIAGGAR